MTKDIIRLVEYPQKKTFSVKHITKIENAKVTPSIYLIHKIAKVLEVSIDTLTDREV